MLLLSACAKGHWITIQLPFQNKSNRPSFREKHFCHPSIPPSINSSLHSSIHPFVRSSIEAKNVHIQKQQLVFGSCDLLWHLDMWWTEPAQLVQTKAFVSLPHTKSQNGGKTLVYSRLFWQFFFPFPYTGMRKNFLPTKFPHPYPRASWQISRLVLVLWVFLARMAFLWFEFADAISGNDCSFFSRVVFTKEAAIVYQKKKVREKIKHVHGESDFWHLNGATVAGRWSGEDGSKEKLLNLKNFYLSKHFD